MDEMKNYENWKKIEEQGKYRLITQRVLNPNAHPCEGSIQSYFLPLVQLQNGEPLFQKNSMVTISLDL